jgi:hypothetical protein
MRRSIWAWLAAAGLLVVTGTAVSAATPPPNDGFGHATAISGLPFQDAVDTRFATRAVTDPNCADDMNTVWWSFRPASNVDVVATTFGSDFDTTLSVYTGTRDALRSIACNDDAIDVTSTVAFSARAGVTYHLMAGTCCGDPTGGNLRLTFVAARPLTMTITLSRFRLHPKTGDVTAIGTVRCSHKALIQEFDVELRQLMPDSTINHGFGNLSTPAPCNRRTGTWKVQIFADLAFHTGPARLNMFVDTCALSGVCKQVRLQPIVRIRTA